MSHFSVLVIGDDIQGQLEPYKENNMGDCDPKFLKFHDQEDEYLKKYKTGSTEMIQLPNGDLKHPWDEMFRKPGTVGNGAHTHETPKGYPRVNVKHKERYKTFEAFVEGWCGDKARDVKNNRYGYWENPDKKWDWYVIGGRWGGYFTLKNGESGKLGEMSTFDRLDGDKRDHAKVDQAKKAAIDFESMREEAFKEAREKWQIVASFFDTGKIPRLKMVWKDAIKVKGRKNFDKLREEYNAQPLVVQFNKGMDALPKEKRDKFSWFASLDEFQFSEFDYATREKNSAISTFAVVKDGQWYEKGEMGWWGAVSDEKDQATWDIEFGKLLDSISDDTLLSVVDCHI